MSAKVKPMSLLLLAVLLVASWPLSGALAANASAQLAPAFQTIGIAQTTTVTLNVQGVENLYGYQTAIIFDPNILEVVDADGSKPGTQVTLGTFLQPDFVQQNNADNSVGAIICVVSQLAPSAAVTGNGALLTITFRGKAQGLSDIHFTDLRLADVNGTAIPTTRQDAQIQVGTTPQPTASNTSTSTPTNTPTATSTTPTATPTATSTTPTATPTATSTTPTATPTATSTTPTATPTATSTTPTATPTATSSAPTATPVPTLAPGQTIIYVVRSGDTLYSIARRFGVSMQTLVQLNAISNPSYIWAGQKLIIPRGAYVTPVPGPNPAVYIVQRGDTLYSIARRYCTTVQALALANRIANPSLIYVGQRIIVPGGSYPPPPPGRVHIVQRGETLYSIARHYGTTAWAIAMANHLYNPNVIYAGQRLVIP
jgi:LysM repeat protein